MTERDQVLLHIWLIRDDGDGVSFMADIEQMLRLIGSRVGMSATRVESPVASFALPSHQFIRLSGEAGSELLGELGIHRAQLVPQGSETGRIATSTVGVELLAAGVTPTTARPGGQILKTYNYPLRRVTRHATGQVSPLDAVLSGTL